MPFYAVKVGRKPGIYKTWPECNANISGFSNPKFHKFEYLPDAEDYMNSKESTKNNFDGSQELEYPYAFVDGSYNPKTKVCGYGMVLKIDEFSSIIQIKGSSDDSELCIMRNVFGEILGAISVINKAIELNLSKINIYYDYNGIEMWANGEWNSKKNFIQKEYIELVQKARSEHNLKIIFHKVQAHTGIELNETVDLLAKEAVGL